MLNTMRSLALLDLNRRFGTHNESLSGLRESHGDRLALLLVEAAEKIPKVYLLQSDSQESGSVRMWSEEVTEEKACRLPFVQRRTAAVGPVFKRTNLPKKTPPYGPNRTTQKLTQDAFRKRAEDGSPSPGYFREINQILFDGNRLVIEDRTVEVGAGETCLHVLEAALSVIQDKGTVFLAVVDSHGRWPGQVPEYQDYLARTLAAVKYTTGTAPAREHCHCPLCGRGPTTVYPNALRGAGINFANMDREGAFPGLDGSRAWQGYALCLDCADLLYIFKFHLMDQFQGHIAGSKALLLPSLLGNVGGRHQFMEDWHDYIHGLTGAKIEDIEEDLMEFFAGRDDAHLVLNILWADFGQVIDNCRGLVTDILPSRLQQLSRCNHAANAWRHPLAPKVRIDEASFDLGMNFLFSLFKRPGGKPAKAANASPQLFAIKRQLAERLYHGAPLPDPMPFQEALLETARWYLKQASDEGKPWGLIGEGLGKKNVPYWTLAGWVRHLARLYHYLDITGVLPMNAENVGFQPRMEALKPYFTSDSGIDRPEKAFAFLLGALYGKLLQVQGARKVNVSANALTWLKRLNLSGRDLPELYVKVREKLLSYGTEASPAVRELLHDLGRLGAELGDRIELDNIATCYFLLLGQSVTSDLLPSRSDSNGD